MYVWFMIFIICNHLEPGIFYIFYRICFNLFFKVFYINFNNNTPKRQAESVIKRLCDSVIQAGS